MVGFLRAFWIALRNTIRGVLIADDDDDDDNEEIDVAVEMNRYDNELLTKQEPVDSEKKSRKRSPDAPPTNRDVDDPPTVITL